MVLELFCWTSHPSRRNSVVLLFSLLNRQWYGLQLIYCKAVLWEKLKGALVLWTCELQGAQHMISMKIFWSPWSKSSKGARGHQAPPKHSLTLYLSLVITFSLQKVFKVKIQQKFSRFPDFQISFCKIECWKGNGTMWKLCQKGSFKWQQQVIYRILSTQEK